MKKFLAIILSLSLAFALVACGEATSQETTAESETTTAEAEEGAVKVTLTICNAGELVLANKEVSAKDLDGDGTITILEAISAGHDAYYEGGAEAGFASETSEDATYITKIWGIDNGGAFGFYVDNLPSSNVYDAVLGGESIYAFAYKDTANFSDAYTYFEQVSVSDGQYTLKLSSSAYDENWEIAIAPLAGASILIDGAETEYVTGEDGTVTISASAGQTITATCDSQTITTPIIVLQ